MSKSQVRVLIVQPWISYRGSESVSVLEAYYLSKAGHSASIACLFLDKDRLPPHADAISYILPPSILQNVFASSKLFFLLFGFPFLLWLVLVNAKKFTLFNPHNLPATWVCAIVSSLSKKPSIWTCHGVPKKTTKFASIFEMVAWFLGISILDTWAVRRMTKIVAVSSHVAQDVQTRYGLLSQVVYPPIEAEFYQKGNAAVVRRKFGLSSEERAILYLARLHPAKEPLLALASFQKLAKKVKHLKLIIAGEGPLLALLQQKVVDAGFSRHVFFAGFVSPKETKHYFAASSVLFSPYSKTEGCPLTPFEALAAGCLPIVAKGSGADELIEKGFGIVATPKADDFANALGWCIMHKKKATQMARKGTAFVQNNLSGQNYVKQLLSLTP